MPIVSLRDFLEFGRFGEISLGADRRAVEQAFGGPEDVDLDSFREARSPVIMKYCDVEFHFSELLWLIHIDRFSGPGGVPQGWGGCVVEPWVVREGMPRAELERQLDVAALPYDFQSKPELEQEWLVFPSGVTVSFSTDPLDPPGLVYLSRVD